MMAGINLNFNFDKFRYYGKWCGPGTDQNQSDKTPVDCLDLCCKLHDYFFKYVNSDQALSDSAKFLLGSSLIAQSQTVGYAETISGFLFQAGSDIWRNKWYLLVTVILLLVAIAMGIGVGIIVINQNKKK
jgi:hypothetical protein